MSPSKNRDKDGTSKYRPPATLVATGTNRRIRMQMMPDIQVVTVVLHVPRMSKYMRVKLVLKI